MTNAIEAMPKRPLHARPPASWLSRAATPLCAALFAASLAYMVGWVAPVLATDWQVRDTAVPVRGARLTDGRCQRHALVYDCGATLTAPAAAPRRMQYLFAALPTHGFMADVLAAPQHPDWLTTDLALDHLWDRILACAVLAAVAVALLAGLAKMALRGRRAHRAWRTAGLVPVALRFERVARGGRAVWMVRTAAGHAASWTFSRWTKPFVLGQPGVVLGLADPASGAAMPLDAGLRWVDLSAAERATVIAAQQPTGWSRDPRS